MPTPTEGPNTILEMQQVVTRFGAHLVHQGVDLAVRQSEIFAVIGGSGSGKSTLLREMILLQTPSAGHVKVLGVDLADITDVAALALRQRFGVLFQHGGLFGALTVLENIGLPLREHRHLSEQEVDAIANQKLSEVGLDAAVASQYPSVLSGGMLKRAALARALVLEPELLFLDEPTAGLDPQSAEGIDALVLGLRQQSGLSIVMITHDLDLLWQVTDRVAVLADGKVQAIGSMAELSRMDNPAIQPFFDGPRARAAQVQATSQPKEPSSKPK
ncbi:MAG: putative ABC transport system ATP-binding protein [Comamonadaceae bacterium]|nr:MAG: putative ABC transport system ATP-binding protein [Comamonadaceae bacterium]